MKKRVTLDFETRSTCDLKKSGAYKYSLDPTTQPTCLAFKLLGSPRIYFLDFEKVNTPWKKLPEAFQELWQHLILTGYLFTAHNAFFETCIYKNILVKRYGWPDIPFRQFRCTAAKVAACALPRSLEGAGRALNLTIQKDYRGYAAMMATCKPTKQWNLWKKKFDKGQIEQAKEPPLFLEPHHNREIWNTLYTYCKIDVKTEELLDETLPDLIPQEQEIWFLNQRLNWQGLRIDIPTVRKIVGIMEKENKIRLKELDDLTFGLVTKPGSRKAILGFLEMEGVTLPDIRAQTVDDILKEGKLSPDLKRLLEIRKMLSKTSTKKYSGMIDRAGQDDRVRDILLYSGASTGRDTGTGIQPHNFPRGLIKVEKDRPYAAVENIIECDAEMLKLLYGENLSILFSAVLRNMIIPSPGKELFVADFSKIEVAVLWWLADNFSGIRILKDGKDPYKYQAAFNTGRRYEDIGDDDPARQLGKAQILGCGFRMGWERFKSSAHDQYRLPLTNKQSVQAVKNYREANAPVVELWDIYENAVIEAVESQKAISAGKCHFECSKGFLWITLPSGRKLAYRKPSIAWKVLQYKTVEEDSRGREIIVTKESSPKKTLQILGLAQDKKNMQPEFKHGGIITENIVQAVARDLMMPAMLREEKAGFQPLLMVHDEGICEKKNGDLDEFIKILCKQPSWGDKNLVIDAKGWKGPRYRK